MSTVVAIDTIKISEGFEASKREIKVIKPILEKQGLIEPLALDKNGEIGRINGWDPARLEAAKELGWTTVIVAHAWLSGW